MTSYIAYDTATGTIKYQLSGSIASPPEGESFIEGTVPLDGKRYKIVDGELAIDDAEPEKMYYDARASEYPAITNQLDALWHAMNTGLLPQVPGFYDVIKDIKDKYPKSV